MKFRALLAVMLLQGLLMAPASAETFKVNPQWLKDNLDSDKLVILDVRKAESYRQGHIPGAISFPDELTYQQKSSGGRIVEPDVMQRLLRERGVDKDDLVVIYDEGKLMNAARVFWTLEVYGIRQVRILDKGYGAWEKKRYPRSNKVPSVKPSQYVTAINNKRIASKFATQLATLNPEQIVIDARSPEAYRGEVSSAKRFGHIPSAINIPAHNNVSDSDDGKSLRDPAELKQIYSNLPKNARVILYCKMGLASAINYLALRELGYEAANYDASWQEWGNDFNLPIEM